MLKKLVRSMGVVFLGTAMMMATGCSAVSTSSLPDYEEESAKIEDSAETKVYKPENFKSNKDETEWKIAVVPQWGAAPWWVRGNEGTKRFAEETKINAYEVSPTEADVASQIQVVEDLISQNVDAICICPIDPSAMETVLQKALDKGIVVVSHEASSIENVLYDLEAFSNEDYGTKLADLLAEAMGEKGTYATMVGNLTKASHIAWTDAEIARMEEKYPDMILCNGENPSMESGDTNAGAYEAAKEYLTANPEVTGILTCGSTEPLGVARALEELGLSGKVKVVSTGMPSECSELVKDGVLSAVCVWDPADACYAMCNLSAKILRGEVLEPENGINLGVSGWDNMKPLEEGSKVLVGQGWLVYDQSNYNQGKF